MTYWNPVERYGVDRFARDLAAAGGAGLITPDLPPDDAGGVARGERRDRARPGVPGRRRARPTPGSTPSTAACRGFVYATAVMGVTGARAEPSAAAPVLVGRVRARTDLPVGVGLGVSDGAQAAAVAGFADAVIVGSAFVRRLLDADSPADGVAGVGRPRRRARRRRPVADGVAGDDERPARELRPTSPSVDAGVTGVSARAPAGCARARPAAARPLPADRRRAADPARARPAGRVRRPDEHADNPAGVVDQAASAGRRVPRRPRTRS